MILLHGLEEHLLGHGVLELGSRRYGRRDGQWGYQKEKCGGKRQGSSTLYTRCMLSRLGSPFAHGKGEGGDNDDCQ